MFCMEEPVGVMVVNCRGDIDKYNRDQCLILGLADYSSMLGKNLFDPELETALFLYRGMFREVNGTGRLFYQKKLNDWLVFCFSVEGVDGERRLLFLTLPELAVSTHKESVLEKNALPAVFVQDRAGKIIAASRSFVETFAGNKKAGFDPDITLYFSPIEIQRARRDLVHLLQGGIICDNFYICRKQDGTPLVIRLTGVPLYDSEGQLNSIVGLAFPCEGTNHRWRGSLLPAGWNQISKSCSKHAPLLSNEQNCSLLCRLSTREIEVLRCIGEGLKLSQISKLLNLSSNTVAAYRRSVLKKLGLKSSAQLVKAAICFGLTSLDPW